MNPDERIHWEILSVRRDNGIHPEENLYRVELRGLFFPREVILKEITVQASRPKKIRNWFYYGRSLKEIGSLRSIGGRL